jgi:hypothetical protein
MVTQPRLYKFALCTTDGDALSSIAFERAYFDKGEVIRQGPAGALRVVHLIEPDAPGQLPQGGAPGLSSAPRATGCRAKLSVLLRNVRLNPRVVRELRVQFVMVAWSAQFGLGLESDWTICAASHPDRTVEDYVCHGLLDAGTHASIQTDR